MTNQIRKIRNIKDLPTWFNLSNYEAARHLDAGSWALHLNFRVGLLREIAKENLTQNTKEAIQNALTKPIDHELKLPLLGGVRTVMPMAVADTFRLTCDLTTHSEALSSCWKWFSEEPGYEWKEPFDELISSEVDKYDLADEQNPWLHGDLHVTVDPAANDEQLLADFKSWLSGWREQSKMNAPVRTFTKRDFTEWADQQVLAYLDLDIWAQTENVSISYQLLGDALLPNEDTNRPEKVRKTIRKKAELLIRKEIVMALMSQADRKTGKQA